MPLTIGLSIIFAGAFGTVQAVPVANVPIVHHRAEVKIRAGVEGKAAKLARAAAFASAVMASPPDPAVEKAVESYFADIPVMISIAQCESKFHQYDLQGNILTSITDDIGVMQINAHHHASEAEDLGYDLTNLQDNMAFARYLYEAQGTDPWLSSARCWSGDTAQAGDRDAPLAIRK